MEHMTATELFATLDVTQADAALIDRCSLFLRRLNILELTQLVYKLTPLDQSHPLVAQSAHVVSNLTQYVNRQGASTHNHEEKTRVDYEVHRVKQK